MERDEVKGRINEVVTAFMIVGVPADAVTKNALLVLAETIGDLNELTEDALDSLVDARLAA